MQRMSDGSPLLALLSLLLLLLLLQCTIPTLMHRAGSASTT